MATTLAPRLRTATEVPCPNPGCDRTFNCDACLHLHLRSRYNLRWADVYGAGHDAWVDFCEAHAGCTPSMLGI